MKLLMCKSCGDVFNLAFKTKKCSCGKTKGKYKKDGIYANYSGDCVPLCFHNTSLINAIAIQQDNDVSYPEEYYGERFEAWICPANSDRFVRSD